MTEGVSTFVDSPEDYLSVSGQIERARTIDEAAAEIEADRYTAVVTVNDYASEEETPNQRVVTWDDGELEFKSSVEVSQDASFVRGHEDTATKLTYPFERDRHRSREEYLRGFASEVESGNIDKAYKQVGGLSNAVTETTNFDTFPPSEYEFTDPPFPGDYSNRGRTVPASYRHTSDRFLELRAQSYFRYRLYTLLRKHLIAEEASVDDVYGSLGKFLTELGQTLYSSLAIRTAPTVNLDDLTDFVSDADDLRTSADELMTVLGEHANFSDWKDPVIGTGDSPISLTHLAELAAQEHYSYFPVLMTAPERYWVGDDSTVSTLRENLHYQKGIIQTIATTIDAGLQIGGDGDPRFGIPVNPEGGYNYERDLARRTRDLLDDGGLASIERSLSVLPTVNPYRPPTEDDGHLVEFSMPQTGPSTERIAYTDGIRYEGTKVAGRVGPAPIARNDGEGSSYFGFEKRLSSRRSDSASERGYTVKEVHTTERHAILSTVDLRVPEDLPGARVRFTMKNLGKFELWARTPEHFVADGIGLGRASVVNRTGPHRFTIDGGDPVSFDDVDRWRDFSMDESLPFVAAFDDQNAISIGLFGGTTAVSEAMTEGSPEQTTSIRLFVEGTRLDTGESASWDLGIAATDGGDGAPARARETLEAIRNAP